MRLGDRDSREIGRSGNREGDCRSHALTRSRSHGTCRTYGFCPSPALTPSRPHENGLAHLSCPGFGAILQGKSSLTSYLHISSISPFCTRVIGSAAMHATNPKNLIVAIAGNLPVIITAPHGGQCRILGVRPRTSGQKDRDDHTLEFAEALARHFAKSYGLQLYVVAARFHRKYVDANRPESCAYENIRARPVYLAYHNHIREFVTLVRNTFQQGGLLLDIHGQGIDAKTIYRGTNDGLTVTNLVRQHGLIALGGKGSVLAILEGKGHRVYPSNTHPRKPPPEDSRFSGGYTVRTYGSHELNGIDAIQLELGIDLRTMPRFVYDLAEAIMTFHETYLRRQ